MATVWSDLTAEQWAVLFLAWLFFFALPAFWIRRDARRVGSPVAHYWFWSTIVLGPLGLYSYRMDRKVRRRKGELFPGEE